MNAGKMPKRLPAEIRNDAWIGDAVLALYAREWILRTEGAMDGELLAAFSSNRFLEATGHPTRVEAEIGRIYQADGLAAAFAWIEERLLPIFLAQQKRRTRQQG